MPPYQCSGLADTFVPCPEIHHYRPVGTPSLFGFTVVFSRPKQAFLQVKCKPCLLLFTSHQIPITQRCLLAPYIANKHMITPCRSRPEFLLEAAAREQPVPQPRTHSTKAAEHHQTYFFPATTMQKQPETKMLSESQKVKNSAIERT